MHVGGGLPLPRLAAGDLSHLPPLDINNIDIAHLMHEFRAMRTEMMKVRVEVKEMKELRAQTVEAASQTTNTPPQPGAAPPVATPPQPGAVPVAARGPPRQWPLCRSRWPLRQWPLRQWPLRRSRCLPIPQNGHLCHLYLLVGQPHRCH